MDENGHGFRHAIAELALGAIGSLAGRGGWEKIMGAVMPTGSFTRLLERHNGHFKRFARLYGEWLTLPELKMEYGEIAKAYSADGRFYHGMVHLHECLMAYDRMSRKLGAYPAIEMAIFPHDEVLDLSRKDNEARSADCNDRFAQRHGIPKEIYEPVGKLILVTGRSCEPKTDEEKLMRDIDISNLGGRWHIFISSNRRLKEEYANVPGSQQGAENWFIRELASKGRIFETGYFQGRYGKRAMRNIKRLLKSEAAPVHKAAMPQ
ncbi:MAG: hypothetical protein NTX79_03350 [Candidatus Micrarchaeota archaeon]|nr:hypothetical protein [Candidatus Micrarchaeota archaeon]